MNTVIVSPKYQVVIPREIRESLQIRPGQKLHIVRYDDRIEFIPPQAFKKMRGFLKGIDTTITRDKDRF